MSAVSFIGRDKYGMVEKQLENRNRGCSGKLKAKG